MKVTMESLGHPQCHHPAATIKATPLATTTRKSIQKIRPSARRLSKLASERSSTTPIRSGRRSCRST
jgi:hypothetical protein